MQCKNKSAKQITVSNKQFSSDKICPKTRLNLHHFPDISASAVNFSDISRLFRQVVTLYEVVGTKWPSDPKWPHRHTCCGHTWNQFLSALKWNETRYVHYRSGAILAHRVKPSSRVQTGCRTLQQLKFSSYLLTVSRPTSTVFSSSGHQTSSCFYQSALHCSYLNLQHVLFAAWFSHYTSAHTPVVQCCSNSSKNSARRIVFHDANTKITHLSPSFNHKLTFVFQIVILKFGNRDNRRKKTFSKSMDAIALSSAFVTPSIFLVTWNTNNTHTLTEIV